MASAAFTSRRLTAAPILAVALLAACVRPSASRPEPPPEPPPGERAWVASWAASPQPSGAKPAVFHGETLREVVHLSAGGDAIRLHLSNAYGTSSLEVTAVHVAASAGGARTSAAPDRAVLFRGAASVVVPTGGVAVSDPVPS